MLVSSTTVLVSHTVLSSLVPSTATAFSRRPSNQNQIDFEALSSNLNLFRVEWISCPSLFSPCPCSPCLFLIPWYVWLEWSSRLRLPPPPLILLRDCRSCLAGSGGDGHEELGLGLGEHGSAPCALPLQRPGGRRPGEAGERDHRRPLHLRLRHREVGPDRHRPRRRRRQPRRRRPQRDTPQRRRAGHQVQRLRRHHPSAAADGEEGGGGGGPAVVGDRSRGVARRQRAPRPSPLLRRHRPLPLLRPVPLLPPRRPRRRRLPDGRRRRPRHLLRLARGHRHLRRQRLRPRRRRRPRRRARGQARQGLLQGSLPPRRRRRRRRRPARAGQHDGVPRLRRPRQPGLRPHRLLRRALPRHDGVRLRLDRHRLARHRRRLVVVVPAARSQDDEPHPGGRHAPPVHPGLRRQKVAHVEVLLRRRRAAEEPERERGGHERLRARRLRRRVGGGTSHRRVPRRRVERHLLGGPEAARREREHAAAGQPQGVRPGGTAAAEGDARQLHRRDRPRAVRRGQEPGRRRVRGPQRRRNGRPAGRVLVQQLAAIGGRAHGHWIGGAAQQRQPATAVQRDLAWGNDVAAARVGVPEQRAAAADRRAVPDDVQAVRVQGRRPRRRERVLHRRVQGGGGAAAVPSAHVVHPLRRRRQEPQLQRPRQQGRRQLFRRGGGGRVDRDEPNAGGGLHAAVRGVRAGDRVAGEGEELQRVGLPQALHPRDVGRHRRLLPLRRRRRLGPRAPLQPRLPRLPAQAARHHLLVQLLHHVLRAQGEHCEHPGPVRAHRLAVRGAHHQLELHGEPDVDPDGAAAVDGDPGLGRPHRQRRPHRLPGRILRQELHDAGAQRARVPPPGARHRRLRRQPPARPAQRRRRGHRRRAPLRRTLPLHQLPVPDRRPGVHQKRMGIRVPAGLAPGSGPVDGDPDAVGERRPAADPRQVAQDGAVRVAGQRRRRRQAQPQQLLGPLPHLRRRLLRRAVHLLRQDTVPVRRVPRRRRRWGPAAAGRVPGVRGRAAAGAAEEHQGADDVRGHEGGGGQEEVHQEEIQRRQPGPGQVHRQLRRGLLLLRLAMLLLITSLLCS